MNCEPKLAEKIGIGDGANSGVTKAIEAIGVLSFVIFPYASNTLRPFSLRLYLVRRKCYRDIAFNYKIKSYNTRDQVLCYTYCSYVRYLTVNRLRFYRLSIYLYLCPS